MIEGCWLMIGSYLNVIHSGYGRADHGLANHAPIVAALAALAARDGALLAVIAGHAGAEGA